MDRAIGKNVRSAPPPLQATDPPSLTSTRMPNSTVVSSAMQSSPSSKVAETPTTTTSSSKRQHRTGPTTGHGKTGTTMNMMVLMLFVCVLMSAIVNIAHVHRNPVLIGSDTAISEALNQFVPHKQESRYIEDERRHDDEEEEHNILAGRKDNVDYESLQKPHYDTLDCSAFDGPSKEIAQEMVYWQDIPSDSLYESPFKVRSRLAGREQYLTFEPDGGGWNNIRMAMETILGLAIATGRILVLPPDQRFYLLAKSRGTQKTDFSFMDFFPMKELATENAALRMITMEEFLIKEAMTGNLRDKYSGQVSFPPENRTNWNGQDVKALKEWLRNVTHTPLWDPNKCIAAFPASGKHEDAVLLRSIHDDIANDGSFMREEYLDKPIPLNASSIDRMKEMVGRRREMCLYDEDMQKEYVIHFMCYHKMRVRMLIHFYIFIYFENYVEDLWMKRFMRDHVRYVDEIQCAAARVVNAMREYVRSKNVATNPNGEFDSFHIRRGDFQFKLTRIEPSEIYNNVRDYIPDGTIIFVATDERSKTFFDELKKHYDIKFLDDFQHVLKDVNHNFYGMIDQLVASRGRLFFGCWFSTFTGFITRIRGYHSVKDKLPGHEDGLLPNTFYYVPNDKINAMHRYAPIQPAFFNREFPTSWRGLDSGIAAIKDFVEANRQIAME